MGDGSKFLEYILITTILLLLLANIRCLTAQSVKFNKSLPFGFSDGVDHGGVHDSDGDPGREHDEDAVHPELISKHRVGYCKK